MDEYGPFSDYYITTHMLEHRVSLAPDLKA